MYKVVPVSPKILLLQHPYDNFASVFKVIRNEIQSNRKKN